MSKAVFFDWDDTLAIKLRSEEEIRAARIKFGDSLVLINDGENRNYTTTDIIQLLKELTKSEHKWFIVSCGNNGSQLKALQVENIKATEEVWLNLGMRCPEDKKLTATTELIRRHFGGNVPNDSLFVDDQIANINIIKGNIPQIKTIKPGEDEEPGTTPHTDGSGQMKDIHATFYVDVGDVKFPRYLLIRDKVDAIRTMLNLPVGGHPPAGAAAAPAPLAGAPPLAGAAPPAAPTRESDEAMALRLAGGVVGTTAFHRQQEGPPAGAAPAGDAPGPTWEWEGDDGQWKAYSAEVSTQLEAAWQTGGRSVDVSDDHYVDPTKLVQKGWEDGSERRVRRTEGALSGVPAAPALAPEQQQGGPLSGLPAPPAAAAVPAGPAVPAGDGPTWEWEGDDGQWKAYSTKVSTQLEAAWQTGGRSVDVGTGHWVDPKKMIQGSWGDGSERRVRRTEGALSGAHLAGAAPAALLAGAAPTRGSDAARALRRARAKATSGTSVSPVFREAWGEAGASSPRQPTAHWTTSAQQKLISTQTASSKGLQPCDTGGRDWKIRVKKDWHPAGATQMGEHAGQGEVYFCIDDEIMKENLKESISGGDLVGVEWWFKRVTEDDYITPTKWWWYNFNRDKWITKYIANHKDCKGKSGDTWDAILVMIGDHVPSVNSELIQKKQRFENAEAQLGALQGLGEQGVVAAREQAIKVETLKTELAALSGGGKKRRNKRRRKNTKRRTKKRKYTKRKSKRSKTKRQSKRQSKKRKKNKEKINKKTQEFLPLEESHK